MATSTEEFYFFFGRWNPLSNWFAAKFTVKGITFCCVEQFMMFCKAKLFKDDYIADLILETDDPAAHKALGRRVRGYNEELWRAKREHYVFVGVLAKAMQNNDVAAFILNTGTKELVEASRNDQIWGVGLAESDPLIKDRRNWRGLNLLGKVAMRVRTALEHQLNKEMA